MDRIIVHRSLVMTRPWRLGSVKTWFCLARRRRSLAAARDDGFDGGRPGQRLAAPDRAAADWPLPNGVLADRVTPGRIILNGPMLPAVSSFRVLSDEPDSDDDTANGDWSKDDAPARAAPSETISPRVSENVILPGQGMPVPRVRHRPIPSRVMPGGAVRDLTPSDALRELSEDTTVPGPTTPGRIMPAGTLPGTERDTPGRCRPRAPCSAESWNRRSFRPEIPRKRSSMPLSAGNPGIPRPRHGPVPPTNDPVSGSAFGKCG